MPVWIIYPLSRVRGWLAQADPATGLIPRNLGRDRDTWNAYDSAADNYLFMVLTCALTDQSRFEGRMLSMLLNETVLTSRVDRLRDTLSFFKRAFSELEVSMERTVFGESEYVKDGLGPLTVWLGASPWSKRMLSIIDIMTNATIETPFGKLASLNAEGETPVGPRKCHPSTLKKRPEPDANNPRHGCPAEV